MTALQTENGSAAGIRHSKRVPKLEGIRGFLALGVLIYHVSYTAGVSSGMHGSGIWGNLASGLTVCLPPFFILSGLLLYRQYARRILNDAPRPSIGALYWGRALRLLPAYWAMAIIVLLTLNFYSIHSIWYVLNPLLLVHFFTITNFNNWIPGLEPTWTVATEATFYLLLPFMAMLIGKFARRATDPARRVRRMLLPLAPIAVAGFVWTSFVFWPANAAHVWYFNFWPFGLFPFVTAGMALATVVAYAEISPRPPLLYRLAVRRPNAFWLIALVIFILNLPFFAFGTPGMGDYPALGQEIVSQVLLIICAVIFITPLVVPNVRSRLMDAVLANPPMRYLGRISYAIYLWQLPFIHFWFKNGSIFGQHHPLGVNAFTGKVGFWELFTFVLAGCIVAGTASRYLIELPALRLRNRFFAQPAPAAVPQRPPVPQAGRGNGLADHVAAAHPAGHHEALVPETAGQADTL
jgi:peptidoglycan/LPS O-acetylase OafA/YrhL